MFTQNGEVENLINHSQKPKGIFYFEPNVLTVENVQVYIPKQKWTLKTLQPWKPQKKEPLLKALFKHSIFIFKFTTRLRFLLHLATVSPLPNPKLGF